MMRQLMIDGRPRPAVFLNGVSYANELGYRERVEGWERTGEYPVTFVPTVSRARRPAQRRLDGPDRPRRDDPGAGPRGAGPDARQLDRLHLRQPGHDPRRPRRRCSPAATPRTRSTRSSTGPRARSPAAWPARDLAAEIDAAIRTPTSKRRSAAGSARSDAASCAFLWTGYVMANAGAAAEAKPGHD